RVLFFSHFFLWVKTDIFLIFKWPINGPIKSSTFIWISEIRLKDFIVESGLFFCQFIKPFLRIVDQRQLADFFFIFRIIQKVETIASYCNRLNDITNLAGKIMGALLHL